MQTKKILVPCECKGTDAEAAAAQVAADLEVKYGEERNAVQE